MTWHSSTLTREAAMSYSSVTQSLLRIGTPSCFCNDESFLRFQLARKEHNASVISLRGPAAAGKMNGCKVRISTAETLAMHIHDANIALFTDIEKKK